MEPLIAFSYMTAVGFVMAGILSSFVQLISGEPMRLVVETRPGPAAVGGVVLRVFAGPAILMRNAWQGMWMEARPKFWFCISTGIAGWWSLFIGTFVLDLILSL